MKKNITSLIILIILIFFGFSTDIARASNQPPTSPTIVEQTNSHKKNETQNVDFTSTDPDGDSIKYRVNWGDGTTNTVSPLKTSGVKFATGHIYKQDGSYTITATAEDTAPLTSPSSTYIINIGVAPAKSYTAMCSVTVIPTTAKTPPSINGQTETCRDNVSGDSRYTFTITGGPGNVTEYRYQIDKGDGNGYQPAGGTYLDSDNVVTQYAIFNTDGYKYIKAWAMTPGGVQSDSSSLRVNVTGLCQPTPTPTITPPPGGTPALTLRIQDTPYDPKTVTNGTETQTSIQVAKVRKDKPFTLIAGIQGGGSFNSYDICEFKTPRVVGGRGLIPNITTLSPISQSDKTLTNSVVQNPSLVTYTFGCKKIFGNQTVSVNVSINANAIDPRIEEK